jgi:TetR/AcrR family transcriptional repressor of nem operon
MTRAPAPTTADQILDVAERLIQTRGFNGFSYADISAALGITKASLHYHFPTKGELGRRIVVRYTEGFRAAFAEIDASEAPAPEKLRRYARLYADVVRDERMCLCGMLAAEHQTLPAAMRDELRVFFAVNEEWLASVVEAGRAAGVLRFEGDSREVARLLLSLFEGAMLVARPYADPGRFEAAANLLLETLASRPST